MAAQPYVSPAISLETLGDDFTQADIVFDGIDHSGASYEARIFLNKPDADETTEETPANGYAGAFHIFGHGGCFGDVGHCEVRAERRMYDPRPGHPLTPARKSVIATDAVRAALRQGNEVTVTVVPVVTATTRVADGADVLKFDELSFVAHRR